MPQETETVIGNPEAQQQNTDIEKNNVGNGEQTVQVSSEDDCQPAVQEDACILKPQVASPPQASSPIKSPVAEATEEFLIKEKEASDYEAAVVAETPKSVSPPTPANSEESETGNLSGNEEIQGSTPPQVVEVSLYSGTVVVEQQTFFEDEPVTVNGQTSEEPRSDYTEPEPVLECPLINGQSNGECKLEPKNVAESEPEPQVEPKYSDDKLQVLNGTIASELVIEDYKLPDVVEVKKNFEYVEPTGHNLAHAPPKKGALSTSLDSQSVKHAYLDVRNDGSSTQWAVFKFEGPTIVTSATGADFAQFKKQFGDDERAFGYIRVQTGDEMSRRAKFLLVTWVGPSVSVLKRAKMSTDKALIKDIVSNFAVELQTENIADIDLQNFETELDKAAGAHYGTGIRS